MIAALAVGIVAGAMSAFWFGVAFAEDRRGRMTIYAVLFAVNVCTVSVGLTRLAQDAS